ncbi:carbon-phosphorus lyase complex subunit PhnI [Labrys wisconsinensis]|uniref:Alpha-D-ribose 1-methylphosphonate 5-triphosphate synthase subunit PhnI n=1 Tax=Labrys wisconsinensis TaxID=425677 RepID=A0ABU0J9V2_9HYPH|nr:carbon-phosphorus lyase complex subunit PhnI [Labrys wisconsinensis]MDQ0471038.1 alpha-D-ribose 1-methylphosphonate 5-triphosphate synthase subunit PhnI [Labrys wisconsinensis]
MYSTIRGGEAAIAASHDLLAAKRRGDPSLAEITVAQIQEQLGLAVDRVMAEGALYDRTLAALSVKQAQGDLAEAIFLLRASRTTLERFGASLPVDPAGMTIRRRISTTHKDVPGGQILGPTYDYTHRLIDFDLLGEAPPAAPEGDGLLRRDGALERRDCPEREIAEMEPVGTDEAAPRDLTREPVSFPASRGERLQNLARADEGFLVGLAYSSLRGYGRTHPFITEIRFGDVLVDMVIPELGITVAIGEIAATECQMLDPFPGDEARPPQFTRGYGLAFGQSERKAIAMAIVDRTLRAAEFGEDANHPVQDEEFVMAHSDNVDASGLIQHLKLPHYVDFQAELQLMRKLRSDFAARRAAPETTEPVS